MRRTFASFSLLIPLLNPLFAAGEERPLQIDDLFSMSSIPQWFAESECAIAPDGQALAFSLGRPSAANRRHMGYYGDMLHYDVWMQAGPGRKAARLTDGAKDSSGWFNPVWSPDGRRLALIGTRDDDARVWVWDKKTSKLKSLTAWAINVRSSATLLSWVDDTHVLFVAMPQGHKHWALFPETQRIAPAEWNKADEGREATVSVLGVSDEAGESAQSPVVIIDVNSGAARVLATNANVPTVSPDKRAVSYTVPLPMSGPKADERLSQSISNQRYSLAVVDLQGRPLLAGESPTDVLPGSIRWSASGRELAFLSFGDSRREPPRLFRMALADGRPRQIELGDLDAKENRLHWTAAGDLLILAATAVDGKRPQDSARRDWWLVAKDGARRLLTEAIPNPPGTLVPLNTGEAFAGVSDGEVWQVSPGGGAPRNLTQQMEPKVEEIIVAKNSRDLSNRKLLLKTRVGTQTEEFWTLDSQAGATTALAKPADKVSVAAYSPVSGSVVFFSSDRQGMFVWRSAPQAPAEQLISANLWLRNVAEGEFKQIEYMSLNGAPLKGWIILPVGYQAGRRYPTITWVYAGSVQGDRPSRSNRIGETYGLNMQVPASREFAVVIPSMPLSDDGKLDDPLLRLTEGVLPAVDKAVAEGVTDPERVFVMGHSFGGFSTYGLITQTHRFKAAVSSAGISNLISQYGVFDARFRYSDEIDNKTGMMDWSEGGQVRLGAPPWKDLGRYLRNSPVTYIERVQTPLLIVHGDLDFVPIQQAEEFFSGLYRQGKPVQFARYEGEEHSPQSPPNVRDMWARIFNWLDNYGDITRDAGGRMVFDSEKVKSRSGAPVQFKVRDWLELWARERSALGST